MLEMISLSTVLQSMGLQRVGHCLAMEQQQIEIWDFFLWELVFILWTFFYVGMDQVIVFPKIPILKPYQVCSQVSIIRTDSEQCSAFLKWSHLYYPHCHWWQEIPLVSNCLAKLAPLGVLQTIQYLVPSENDIWNICDSWCWRLNFYFLL